MVELYSMEDNQNDLSRSIGKLMNMKGSMGWHEFIEKYLKGTKISVYKPVKENIIQIIDDNLNNQLRNGK